MGFGLFILFERVTQGFEDIDIASILFEFFLSLHDGKIEFPVGFGFGKELSIIV